MDKQFRVRKSTYYNERGIIENESYYVQQHKSILGIKFWKDINTYFNTYFEAYEFAVKLKTGLEINKHKDILTHIKVVGPLPYEECIQYLAKCGLVITDSGGLQEESSFLKKKCIVCRKTTERIR